MTDDIFDFGFTAVDENELEAVQKASKEVKNINQLASKISFKKNKIIGNKIKKIGVIISKKTLNEINKFI